MAIQKRFPGRFIPCTGRGKPSKRKSYMVLEGDRATMRFLAELRGVCIKDLIDDERMSY